MDEPATKVKAVDEISSFIESEAPGIQSQFTATTLNNACTTLFTTKGLYCPVRVVEKNGIAYLIRRAPLGT